MKALKGHFTTLIRSESRFDFMLAIALFGAIENAAGLEGCVVNLSWLEKILTTHSHIGMLVF